MKYGPASSSAHRSKTDFATPTRYDDVLARLLDLNQKRHQEEVAAGLHGKLDKKASAAEKKKSPAKGSRKPVKTKTRSIAPPAAGTLALFGA